MQLKIDWPVSSVFRPRFTSFPKMSKKVQIHSRLMGYAEGKLVRHPETVILCHIYADSCDCFVHNPRPLGHSCRMPKQCLPAPVQGTIRSKQRAFPKNKNGKRKNEDPERVPITGVNCQENKETHLPSGFFIPVLAVGRWQTSLHLFGNRTEESLTGLSGSPAGEKKTSDFLAPFHLFSMYFSLSSPLFAFVLVSNLQLQISHNIKL